MNKTSGFREIEFKEQVCKYKDIGFTELEYCYNGMLFLRRTNHYGVPLLPVMTRRACPVCKGNGTVDKLESKVE
jgi:hypothetical protein